MGDMGDDDEGWTETEYANGRVHVVTHPEKKGGEIWYSPGFFGDDDHDIGDVFRAIWNAAHENHGMYFYIHVKNMDDDWRLFWTHLSPKIGDIQIRLHDVSNDAFAEMCNYISRSEIENFIITVHWKPSQWQIDKMTGALLECKNLRRISVRDVTSDVDMSQIFCASRVNAAPKKISMFDVSQTPAAWNNIFQHILSGVQYESLSFGDVGLSSEMIMNLCKAVQNGRVLNMYIYIPHHCESAVAPIIDILKRGALLRQVHVRTRLENEESSKRMFCDIKPNVVDMCDRKNPLSMRVEIMYPAISGYPVHKPLFGRNLKQIRIRNKFHGVIAPSKI